VTADKLPAGGVPESKLPATVDFSAKDDVKLPPAAIGSRAAASTLADGDEFLIRTAAGVVKKVSWLTVNSLAATSGQPFKTLVATLSGLPVAVNSHIDLANADYDTFARGALILSQAHSAQSSANKVLVRVCIPLMTAAVAGVVVVAICRLPYLYSTDYGIIGLGTIKVPTDSYGTTPHAPFVLEKMMTAGRTSEVNYQVRVGILGTTDGWIGVAGTVNGSGDITTDVLANELKPTLTVTEIKA
jgi:hypothetical protein